MDDRQNESMLTAPMLIGMISRMFLNLMRNTDPPGSVLTQNSCRLIIRWLAREDGVSQLELSKRTGLKPPTVSVVLSKLELYGYVRRENATSDGREVRVYLTEKGVELNRQTSDRVKNADAILMRDVTPEEEAELCRILLKMKNSLSENENAVKPYFGNTRR